MLGWRSSSICCLAQRRHARSSSADAKQPVDAIAARARAISGRQAGDAELRSEDEQEDQRETGHGQRHERRSGAPRRRGGWRPRGSPRDGHGDGCAGRPGASVARGLPGRWAVPSAPGRVSPKIDGPGREVGRSPARGARCSRSRPTRPSRSSAVDSEVIVDPGRRPTGGAATWSTTAPVYTPSTKAASPTATAAWRRTSMPGGNVLAARPGRAGRGPRAAAADASRNTAIVVALVHRRDHPPAALPDDRRPSQVAESAHRDPHLVGVVAPQRERRRPPRPRGGRSRPAVLGSTPVAQVLDEPRRRALASSGVDDQPGPEDACAARPGRSGSMPG